MIIAISALRTGVNILEIVLILYINIPFSIIDFAQQSGRDRYSGEEISLLIFTPNQKAETRLQQGKLDTKD